MKNLFLLFALVALHSFTFGQRKLEAFFTHSTFYSPESGPYVEAYLSINSSTLKYIQLDSNHYQGKIEVTYIFNKEGKIASFKKYEILSPIIADTVKGLIDFVDMQRLPIPNGNYEFEIIMKDLNRDMAPFSGKQDILVDIEQDSISLSDITFLKNYRKAKPGEFSKSGINITPYMTDFYPEVQKKLTFYTEINNSNKTLGDKTPYLVKYYLKDYHADNILNNWSKYRKLDAQNVNILLDEFNIEKLPSGNYHLVVELVNRENKLLDKKLVFFQRSNPSMESSISQISLTSNFEDEIKRISNRDTMIEYVKCLEPIASRDEKNFINENYKTNDLANLHGFFIRFWTNRYPESPGKEWLIYKKKINYVNKHYSTLVVKGYQTDRGRVYLNFGAPNHIVDRQNEPSSYPYIIWHYYKHPKRSDAKYVFYNPDLVTNDYELLHSNVYGERNNYRWKFMLQKRNTNARSLDVDRGHDHWGGRVDDYYNNPR